MLFRFVSGVQNRLWQGLAGLAIFGVLLSIAPAHAVVTCSPDPATSGQTVTCSGLVPGGFQAGAGVDGLTVNVLPGAIVNDNGTAAIGVNDSNVVTNNGTLAAGTGAFGIFGGGVNNTITNAANGTITVSDNGSGIFVAGNSTVTNAGSIAVGSTFGFSAGILAINHFNTVTNSAGASINVGSGVVGILMQGNDATLSNAGSITTVDAPALYVQGNGAAISNSGVLTTGAASVGIVYTGLSSTITNSGRIIGGDNTTGIVALGDSLTITNSGTITVGSGFATGIDVTSVAGSNNVVNTGTINVGAGGTGILVSGTGSVFNSGTINAATGFAAIEFCGCGINNVLTLGPRQRHQRSRDGDRHRHLPARRHRQGYVQSQPDRSAEPV